MNNLSKALLNYLQDEEAVKNLQTEFLQRHQSLRHDARNAAETAILKMIE